MEIGSIGGALARRLSAARHRVSVANSEGAEGVRSFADEIGATADDVRGAQGSVPTPAMPILSN